MTTAVRCPHCDEAHDTRALAQHIAHCIANPAVRAATLAALADPDAPGCAVGYRQYGATRGADAVSARTLLERYATWAAVCAEFGLQLPSRKRRPELAQVRMSAEARELAQAREDDEAAARAREAVRDWGLAVCRVRTLQNGAVAMELR